MMIVLDGFALRAKHFFIINDKQMVLFEIRTRHFGSLLLIAVQVFGYMVVLSI